MKMDREITVTLSPRVLRWAVFYQLRSLIILFGSIALALIGAAAFMGQHEADPPNTVYVLPVFMLFFLLFVFYLTYSRSMAIVRKLGNPDRKYRITDEYLYVESDLSSGKSSWTIFKGLKKNAKLWRVVIPSGAVFVIPAECLDEELKAFLSAKLPSKPFEYLNSTFMSLVFYLILVFLLMYWLRRG